MEQHEEPSILTMSLYQAADKGNLFIVEKYLHVGADVNAQDEQGCIVLQGTRCHFGVGKD